ncbi:MAG: DUF2203 family protein [Thermoplasmata archaeon]|nr:DUF2203 family protein [Candidatus Sysuiplasma acidicola]MBX8637522.1 DUF2203 family protein [Candidatus Sysuiplasma acidicola]MBX8647002.1 DUF2203 family protein [Candidatus Sysuiplasma acidicola]MDH2906251.1 DUF2203 domain-containing protein [Methanomassiliicoccales archaeon]
MNGKTEEFRKSEPPVRFFTVDEANDLIPTLESRLKECDRILLEIRTVAELAEDMEWYWGESIRDDENPDRGEYLKLEKEKDARIGKWNAAVGNINALGVVLKNPDTGLIDFYSSREGQVIFLCWQRGEPEVRYWHTLEGGYAGRRPLE